LDLPYRYNIVLATSCQKIRILPRGDPAAMLLGPFVPEDGSNTILPNVGKYLLVEAA
jgi:hypothetical protein